jgi:hypothetical protein
VETGDWRERGLRSSRRSRKHVAEFIAVPRCRDESVALESTRKVGLMIVDVLAVATEARHDHRDVTMAHSENDRANPGVSDYCIRPLELRKHIVEAHEGLGDGGVPRCHTVAVLDDQIRDGKRFDRSKQASEPVMVRPDGHEDHKTDPSYRALRRSCAVCGHCTKKR